MSPSVLTGYATRIETDLRANILDFWMRHVVDRERGAFFGALTNDRTVDRRAERGALLTCRILWTFSAAYRRYGEPAYRAMADRAYADLSANFADGDHGGFYWSIAADGRGLRDRKQVYGQAFAIYALAEYHRATGEPAARHTAIAVFRLLEKYARDPGHGGYLEAFSRTWQPIEDMRLSVVDLNEPKSQNTHLHVMEAYTNLLRIWPDPQLRTAQTRLLETMLDHIVDPQTCHLGLFFARDWSLRSDKVSYGHDIEAAWLFTEAAEVLGNSSLTARIRPLAVRIAEVTLAQGIDADGGVYNEGGPQGLTDTNKEWWPQAEAVVGFLNAHALSRTLGDVEARRSRGVKGSERGEGAAPPTEDVTRGDAPPSPRSESDDRYLQAALRCWDFIEQRLIDQEHGEWLRGVTREGQVLADQLKVSFWKCPYHNGRTGLEAPARLRALAASL